MHTVTCTALLLDSNFMQGSVNGAFFLGIIQLASAVGARELSNSGLYFANSIEPGCFSNVDVLKLSFLIFLPRHFFWGMCTWHQWKLVCLNKTM